MRMLLKTFCDIVRVTFAEIKVSQVIKRRRHIMMFEKSGELRPDAWGSRVPRVRKIVDFLLLVFCSILFLCSANGAASSETILSDKEELANQPPVDYLDRSGLRELVFWQAINGAIAGGLLSTAITAGQVNDHCVDGEDQNNSSKCRDALARSGGIVAVGLATGIALPYWLTRGKPVSTSDAITINRMTMLGAMHGYIIPFAAGLEPLTNDPDVIEADVNEIRWLSGLTFAGDLLGVGAGIYLANNYENDPGFVSFVGTLHFTTFLAAGSIGAAFADDLDQDNNRFITGSSLIAADIALATALYYRNDIDIGRNRVFWIDTGAVVGWMAGAGVGSIIGGEDQRPISIGATLGMAAGIYGTYISTRNSKTWRRRADFEIEGFRFQAPSLSIRPIQKSDGSIELGYYADLRGRF